MLDQNRENMKRQSATSGAGEGIDANETIGRSNLPAHEVRMGKIVAAIWAHDTQYGPRHNVTLTRIYKEGEEWKRSDSFGRDDLLLVCKVLDRAHNWIFQQEQVRVSEEA